MKVTVTFEHEPESAKELAITQKVGSGKFEVFHGKVASTGEEYAVKIFPHSEKSSKTRFSRESELLSTFDHPNIMKHHAIKEHDFKHDLLIFDFATNGDFFNIVTAGGLSHEVHMRTYFQQLIVGLEYLHSKGVAHMDVKLENLLMGKDYQLKIIDFDQSQTKEESRVISGGTSSYRAPEVLEKNCLDIFAADIYAAGVTLFTFKSGQFPFLEIEKDGKVKMVYYDMFIENNPEFWEMKAHKMGKKAAEFFTEDFRILINGMLEKDPSKRMTIQDIKASEWFNKPTLSPEGLKFHMHRACQRINQK